MKAIKVNADYEMTLAGKKGPSSLINESLEFIALYLDERPLFSAKKYAPEFLEHVFSYTGNHPQIVNSGAFENWWGALENIPLEQRINSKEFTAALSDETQIISQTEDLKITGDKTYIAKAPLGMSGQDIVSFRKGEENKVHSLLSKTGNLIIEPLYEREWDFSHYVFPSGESICYENLVNSAFQYKGTLFSDLRAPVKQSLRFYSEIEEGEWRKFQNEFVKVSESLRKEGAHGGFSLDSFTYKKDGDRKIRAVCEVNYRKSMGLVTWLLSKKYSKENSWSLLILGKSKKKENSFQSIKKRISPVALDLDSGRGCLLLSPGNTRFEAFFLSAGSHTEGRELFLKLTQLLPDTEFTVEI